MPSPVDYLYSWSLLSCFCRCYWCLTVSFINVQHRWGPLQSGLSHHCCLCVVCVPYNPPQTPWPSLCLRASALPVSRSSFGFYGFQSGCTNLHPAVNEVLLFPQPLQHLCHFVCDEVNSQRCFTLHLSHC